MRDIMSLSNFTSEEKTAIFEALSNETIFHVNIGWKNLVKQTQELLKAGSEEIDADAIEPILLGLQRKADAMWDFIEMLEAAGSDQESEAMINAEKERDFCFDLQEKICPKLKN